MPVKENIEEEIKYEEFSKEDRQSVAKYATKLSRLTQRFHNAHINDFLDARIRTHQKPNKDLPESHSNFFFISYSYTDEQGMPSWIRQPMVDEDDLLRYLLYIELLKRTGSVSDLQIYNESSLDEMVTVTLDNGETKEITRRLFHFDERYQYPHDKVAEEIRIEEESASVAIK